MTTLEQAKVHFARRTSVPTNLATQLDNDEISNSSPGPKPLRRRGMTWEKLIEKVQLGLGQGHGTNYQPWLKIRRKNPSPRSNQVVAWLPPLGRSAHFFSRGEYHFALLLLWLGVIDLREQYPLWPLPHPHPISGAEGTKDLTRIWSRGLLEIAADASIKHGREPGTNLPYIATMDFMVTFPTANDPRSKAFSSKPFDVPDENINWRTAERLELERCYTHELDIPYNIISSGLVPLSFAGQLEWFIECATLDFAPDLLPIADSFAEVFSERPDVAITEAVTHAAHRYGLELPQAWFLFRHCVWTTKIDIDLTSRVVVTHPCQPGGRALRNQLRVSLFDGAWL